MCMYICVCVCIYIHACGGQREISGIFPQIYFTPVWDGVSYWPVNLGRLAMCDREADIPASKLPFLGKQTMPHYNFFPYVLELWAQVFILIRKVLCGQSLLPIPIIFIFLRLEIDPWAPPNLAAEPEPRHWWSGDRRMVLLLGTAYNTEGKA